MLSFDLDFFEQVYEMLLTEPLVF